MRFQIWGLGPSFVYGFPAVSYFSQQTKVKIGESKIFPQGESMRKNLPWKIPDTSVQLSVRPLCLRTKDYQGSDVLFGMEN